MKRGTKKLAEKLKSRVHAPPFELIMVGTPRATFLETETSPCKDFTSKLRQEIRSLQTTANIYGATGLSANQVGLDKRFFIMAKKLTEGIWLQQNNETTIEYNTIINPRIVEKSKLMQFGWEYCASIPNVRAVVKRHESITVVYIDEKMNEVKEVLSGFAARIFQHEMDHLDGNILVQQTISHDELETLSESEDGDIEVAKVLSKFYTEVEQSIANKTADKMQISEEEFMEKLQEASRKDYERREKLRESSPIKKKKDPNYFY